MQSITLVSSGFAHCTALCSGPSKNQYHKPCLCTRRATNISYQEALSDPSHMHAEWLSALVRKRIWKNLHADDVPSIVRNDQKPLCRNEYCKFPCSSPRHLVVFTGSLVPRTRSGQHKTVRLCVCQSGIGLLRCRVTRQPWL